jgi:tetratricopeptide (TPR) repeat protein
MPARPTPYFRHMKVRSLVFCAVSCLLASQVHSQDAAKLIAEGDSLLHSDRPQKAADKYTAAIELAPSVTGYVSRAKAWAYMDRMDRYLLDVEKALDLDSLNAEANYQRAYYAARGEDHKNTLLFASRALAGSPSPAVRQQALVLRGMARAELKDPDGAIADLSEGLGDRTDDLAAMKALARVYDAKGDHASSLVMLERLCMVEPEDIGNWTNRGYELAMLGKYDEALTMYGEALAMDKDEPTALSNRAHALLQLGREDEALKDVERSLKAYPGNAFALRTRAIIRIHKGEKEKACSDLSLARIIGGVPDVDKLIEENGCTGR